MESPEEAYRLHVKTDREATREQLNWCGVGPGARVLDVGCGSGAVTDLIREMVQPNGRVVGIDYSSERLAYAREHFGSQEGVDFLEADITNPLQGLAGFDFVWVRFVLEYFLEQAPAIVSNLIPCLGPEGQLCLLDLDYNCLTHYELPAGMTLILHELVEEMADTFNFDPFAGRKLYACLYDLGFRDIEVGLVAHHLIYGQLRSQDAFNWTKKLEMASLNAPEIFRAYPGGYEGFFSDFTAFSQNPRRFTYSPLIMCKGRRPREEAANRKPCVAGVELSDDR